MSKNYVILDLNKLFMLNRLKFFFEKHGFHVSSRLADALGMRASSVRLFFIYLSFVTVGLWFAVYLILAFWMNIRRYLRQRNNPSVWDI